MPGVTKPQLLAAAAMFIEAYSHLGTVQAAQKELLQVFADMACRTCSTAVKQNASHAAWCFVDEAQKYATVWNYGAQSRKRELKASIIA